MSDLIPALVTLVVFVGLLAFAVMQFEWDCEIREKARRYERREMGLDDEGDE